MRINSRTYSNTVYASLVLILREVSSLNFTITQIQQVNLQQLTQTTTQTEIVILSLTWHENTTFQRILVSLKNSQLFELRSIKTNGSIVQRSCNCSRPLWSFNNTDARYPIIIFCFLLILQLRKSDNILNVESLFSSYFISKYMRFKFSPQYVSLNQKLKSGNILNFEQIFKQLHKMNDTWLSPSSSRSDEIQSCVWGSQNCS